MTQTNRPDPGGRRSPGSYSVGGDGARRRPAWLIPLALLGLLLLGLLLWRLLSDNDSDTTAAAVPTPSAARATATSAPVSPSVTASATATPAATGSGSSAGVPADGQLLLGGQSVLPLPATGADLGRYTGTTATARAVQVQSVPADEGFWVGTSTTDRVWVQLTGQAGESGYTVKQGDRIDFSNGRTVAHNAGFAGRTGVSAAEGAAQLTGQGQHVEVAKSALKLSS